jgi:hypothetical protein
MSSPAQQLLEEFDLLSEADRREVAAAILRRILAMNWPPLSDDELVLNAEAIFLELDQQEIVNERPESR